MPTDPPTDQPSYGAGDRVLVYVDDGVGVTGRIERVGADRRPVIVLDDGTTVVGGETVLWRRT